MDRLLSPQNDKVLEMAGSTPKKVVLIENCCENKMQSSVYPNRAKAYKSMTMLVLRELANNNIEKRNS